MDAVTYKCPGCGAGLKFGIDSQKWDCDFCGGSYTKPELEEMPQVENGGEYFGGEASAYECPSCGGRIITDAVTAATFCVYCHNPTIISSRLKNNLKPDYILPFRVKKDEAVAAVQKLCGHKPLLAKAFRDGVNGGEVSGLYVPFWLFSGDMSARLEGRGQNITSWRDSRFIYTKTDTFSVIREADISVADMPADGSSKMNDTLMEALEPFDYAGLKPFSMEYVSGHYAETYDIDARQSENRAVSRMKDGASGLMREHAGGYTSLSVNSLDVKMRKTGHKYALLPVWTLMYEFGGKQYYFAMNGQTGKAVGKLPVSWPRFFGVMAGVSAAVFGIMALFQIFA